MFGPFPQTQQKTCPGEQQQPQEACCSGDAQQVPKATTGSFLMDLFVSLKCQKCGENNSGRGRTEGKGRHSLKSSEKQQPGQERKREEALHARSEATDIIAGQEKTWEVEPWEDLWGPAQSPSLQGHPHSVQDPVHVK